MIKNYPYCLLLIAIVFAGCSKITVDEYQTSSRSTISNVTTTPSINPIAFDIKDQIVKVTLVNKTLTMNYYENIALVVRADSLKRSSSVTFNEDFKSTLLAKLTYTTIGKTGVVTTNYAEPNLNNVVTTSKDTLINGVLNSKIMFNRVFTYVLYYNTSAEAGANFDYLLTLKESIGFSSFLNYSNVTSVISATKANLLYVAN